MRKLILAVIFFAMNFCVFAQTSVSDFITKPSAQMPSFVALQNEQFKSTFDYELSPDFSMRTQEYTICNEFNFNKINSGFGLNYIDHSSFSDVFNRSLILSYNYKIKTDNVDFIPAVSYEGVKYFYDEDKYDSAMSSNSMHRYAKLHGSFGIITRNLNLTVEIENLNQPKPHYSFDNNYVIPLKYNFFGSYMFLKNNKFVDYLQISVYNELFKFFDSDKYFYTLSTGLNTKYKIFRIGFDVNFTNLFNANFKDLKTNYFIGVEKNNVSFYYGINQNSTMFYSSFTNYRIHNFNLSVNFDLFKKKTE
jgi:hypothetical protein